MSKEKIPKRDFIIAEPSGIVSSSTKFSFSKDSATISRQSLRAKVRMTYAGLRTKNRAVYLPSEHFKSAHTFLTPYNKPVQVHHQDHVDPIGRVIDVRYVDTTASAAAIDNRVRKKLIALQDERTSPLDRLKSANLFLELSQNPDYKGVGHILGLWDISDPDAVQKLLDGRYLTVSTGMMPKHAYCNICAREGVQTDWARDFCEHERGRIYDGLECVAIPTDYEWEEVSPVNPPAAPLSQVVEVGQGLQLSDIRSSDLSESSPQQVFEDFYLLTKGSDTALRIRDGAKVDVPKLIDKNYSQTDTDSILSSGSIAPEIEATVEQGSLTANNSLKNTDESVIGEERNPHMEVTGKMAHKLTVLSEDTVSNYAAIAENLKDGVIRLTDEELGSLEDSVFIGPNRTFPVVDISHAEAIGSLLGEIDDSDAKKTLVDFLERRVEKLNAMSDSTEVTTTETETVETTETTETTETVDGGNTTETTGETEETVSAEAQTTETEIQTTETEATETTETTETQSEELTMTQDALEQAELDRDIWKARCSRLEDEIKQLSQSNTGLLKDQKLLLAQSLVEAQTTRGFQIADTASAINEYSSRSIQSLRDSLLDLKQKTVDGTSRAVNGERVADPRITDSADQNETVIDASSSGQGEFDGILERYWNLFYGPGGQKAASDFLDSVKRNGIVPLTLQP